MPLSTHGAWLFGVWFSGAVTAPSDVVPAAYPAAIAGHPYNIEPALYEIGHVPIQREAATEQAEPGEANLSPAGMWRRSQSDWSLGAGQLWLDEEESTRRRFHTSLGVEVFNDREISLLNDTEQKRSSGSTNLKMLVTGSRLYEIDGANLRFSDATSSEQNATWVTGWTAATGLPGGNLLDMAYSGAHVYVLASDNSIYRATPGTAAFTLWFNPAAVLTRLWFAIGRLFASNGRTLYEITATPGETTIFQHPSADYVVNHVCGAPTGIYISGQVGADYGEVRHSWVNDDGTALVTPVVVAELDNEAVNVTATAGSNIVLGTSVGFRYAPIDGLTTGLSFGPAVEVGNVADLTVEAVINPEGKLDTFVWGTWTNIDGTGNSGLVKIRLTRFVEPLVPAYASDIFTTAGGNAISVASIRGRRYFAIAGTGFYGSNLNKVSSGYLTTGRIRYGVLDNKVFSDLKWRSAPLDGTIEAEVLFDDTSTTSAGAQSSPDSVSADHSQIGPKDSEWAEITFTLHRDAGDVTTGPVLRWWVMRAIPASETTMVFRVPLRLFDAEQTPLGPWKGFAITEELDFLMALMNAKNIVKYQIGAVSYSVYINNVLFGGDRTTRWNKNEHVMEGITMVELFSTSHQ